MSGRESVEMRLTSFGQIRPKVKRPIDPARLDEVLKVCPGVEITGPRPFPAGEAGVLDPVWGPIKSLHRVWASDEEIRFRAAAGGALTALGRYLLRSGEVQAVLHVAASKSEPALTDAKISTTVEDVVEGAQSRYGPAAPLVHVKALLDQGLRFAVIAKPCDIAAIRNLGRVDARVGTQIPYCLTIFCGGVPTSHTAYRIAAYHGLSPDELGLFRWRGHGWPGPTHIESKNGRSFDLSYDTTWYDPRVPWTYDIQFRCKICPDAIGELADVACPDGWVMENGKVTVQVSSCGDALCGRIVALKKPLDKHGNPKLDKDNPDPALRNRPVIGLTLFTSMKQTGNNQWEGRIYVPDDGNTYDAMVYVSGGIMKVKGCVVVLCKSKKFVRIE